MAHFMISAAHKSSGKTTISLGLIELLRRRGLRVTCCKKGPDYIDPIWLSLAAGNACRNLDTFIASEEEVIEEFHAASSNADITLIEGNKGLYDGVALDGSNSNAAVAKLINAPVILVIDCRGMTRGIAPLLLGYQMFDNSIRISGVILNRVGGRRHESKLRASVEHFTDIPVLGAIHEQYEIRIAEQHLGLVPGNEFTAAQRNIKTIADSLSGQLDLDRILKIAYSSAPVAKTITLKPDYRISGSFRGLRVAIARDKAFGFYYPGDLQAFKNFGAELSEFDSLSDTQLPKDIDAIFIGGGFPERHAASLAANKALMSDIRNKIEAGLPAYAECGGLMYLCDSITWQGQTHQMAGLISAECTVHSKPQGRGYVKLQASNHRLWPESRFQQPIIHAHEFHYSRLESIPEGCKFAYRLSRGTGLDGSNDGLIYKNLVASYTHMRHTNANPWVLNFLSFIARQKKNRTSEVNGKSLCHPAVSL